MFSHVNLLLAKACGPGNQPFVTSQWKPAEVHLVFALPPQRGSRSLDSALAALLALG